MRELAEGGESVWTRKWLSERNRWRRKKDKYRKVDHGMCSSWRLKGGREKRPHCTPTWRWRSGSHCSYFYHKKRQLPTAASIPLSLLFVSGLTTTLYSSKRHLASSCCITLINPKLCMNARPLPSVPKRVSQIGLCACARVRLCIYDSRPL